MLPVRIALYILNICEYAMVCECESMQGVYEWVMMECRLQYDAQAKGL